MVTSYLIEKVGYYKILIGLLLLTVVTFSLPEVIVSKYTFSAQMFIATVKAWLILMYYMHLKGERVIGWTVLFSLLLVAFFFTIVMIDVNHFQFADVSHITSPQAH